MAVTFASTACPAVVPHGATIYLADTGTPPPTSQDFTTALAAVGTSARLNSNFKAADMAQRYGAGGYGIGAGLALSAGTGLLCAIADGQAVMDGIVEVYSIADVVVSASTNNWIWLKEDGTIVVQSSTTAKPAGNCCLLGCAITDGSGVTSIDTSGVVYFRGGDMWRATNDLGMPGDTPDASLWFYTKTQTGLWLWNGASYCRVDARALASVSMAADANYTALASEYAQRLLVVTSTLSLTATRDVILPTTVQDYQVVNNTTGGQSLRFKTLAGTGITVANGKAACIFCDGTNVIRITSDA